MANNTFHALIHLCMVMIMLAYIPLYPFMVVDGYTLCVWLATQALAVVIIVLMSKE